MFQCRREVKALKSTAGSAAQSCSSSLDARRTSLKKKIDSWRKLQLRYLPQNLQSQHLALESTTSSDPGEEDNTGAIKSEKLSLLLPSKLSASERSSYSDNLDQKELQLRLGQAEDCLESLRSYLGLRRHLLHHKRTSVDGSGQGPNTRARTVVASYTLKIRLVAETYRAARSAIKSLSADYPQLSTNLLPLEANDVRFPSTKQLAALEERRFDSYNDSDSDNENENDNELPIQHPRLSRRQKKANAGQSCEEVPWIWRVGRRDFTNYTTDEQLQQDLRVEWARAHSRVLRWSEESNFYVLRCAASFRISYGKRGIGL
jgi:hypothetical protein